MSGSVVCLVVRMVVRSWAYESPFAPFVDVRQVAAGVSFSGAPALSYAPYVTICRPVLWVNGSESGEKRGSRLFRWDVTRTLNLWFWSTRRVVQGRLRTFNLPLNSPFLATHRPESSKNDQPLCNRLLWSHLDHILGDAEQSGTLNSPVCEIELEIFPTATLSS